MEAERALADFSKRVMFLFVYYSTLSHLITDANGGMASSASFKDATKIEHVLDWPNVVKKYYAVVKNKEN